MILENCMTCENDRLVYVGVLDGYECYAPCPACHPLSGEDYFMVGEGKKVRATVKDNKRAMDPAKVREMMRR